MVSKLVTIDPAPAHLIKLQAERSFQASSAPSRRSSTPSYPSPTTDGRETVSALWRRVSLLARAGILRTPVLSMTVFSSRLSSSDDFNAAFCGLTSYIGCTPDSNPNGFIAEDTEDKEEVIAGLLFLSNGRLLPSFLKPDHQSVLRHSLVTSECI
jgi:hypothetical protein